MVFEKRLEEVEVMWDIKDHCKSFGSTKAFA
jgi:hypothetical protein